MTAPNPWPETLDRLRHKMTRATFDTWLNGTTATVDGETLTVHVANTFAIAWLRERLHGVINEAVASVSGQRFEEIRYQVGGGPEPEQQARPEPPGPGQFSVELISFDPTQWGFVQTSRYSLIFWQPLLGAFPFHIWVTLRAFAWNAEAEGWPSITTLADICANGNRHRLLGRAARTQRSTQVGALEILARAKIIHVRTIGKGRKTSYRFRVLDNLPLLTPRQVEELTPALQQRHKEWLWKCSIDYEEWNQLSFDSLIEPE